MSREARGSTIPDGLPEEVAPLRSGSVEKAEVREAKGMGGDAEEKEP